MLGQRRRVLPITPIQLGQTLHVRGRRVPRLELAEHFDEPVAGGVDMGGEGGDLPLQRRHAGLAGEAFGVELSKFCKVHRRGPIDVYECTVSWPRTRPESKCFYL